MFPPRCLPRPPHPTTSTWIFGARRLPATPLSGPRAVGDAAGRGGGLSPRVVGGRLNLLPPRFRGPFCTHLALGWVGINPGEGAGCVATCLSRDVLQDFVCGRISLPTSVYPEKAGQLFLAILPTGGGKKKSKRKRKTETKQACKHRARLMRSEFLFLPRNKEVGTLSKQFVMGFLIIPAL